MLDDLKHGLIAWGVPLAGTWLVAQVPLVRKRMEAAPILSAVLISAALSVSVVYTYDRYFLLPIAWPPGDSCPAGQVLIGVHPYSQSGGEHGQIYRIDLIC